MLLPPHAPRWVRQRRQRQQQRGVRGEIKTNASALLLSLALLADKPDVALGWMHSARHVGGRQQAGGSRSATSLPAAVGTTNPNVARQRMLRLVAVTARRPGRRSPSRLAGAAGTDPGKTFEAPVVEGAVAGQAATVSNRRSSGESAVVASDRRRVDQMKEWGAKGMWREAMEQLEKERRSERKPVSGLL